MVLCSTTQTHLLLFVRLRHDYLCVSPASTSLTHTLDPSLTGNGHFAVPISLCTSPHPPPPPPRFLHTGNRSQIISSTLRATRQLLSLLWSPPVAPVSLAPSSSSEWTFLCYRYSSGAKGGVGVIPFDGGVAPRLVSLLPPSCNTRLIGESEEESPFLCLVACPQQRYRRYLDGIFVSDPPRSPPAVEASRRRRSLLVLHRPRERVFISQRLY